MRCDKSLIAVLADGKFHSGEAIACSQGISRTMVWKRVQQIQKEYKLPIQSVKGRGYRLAQPLELLDELEIRAALSQEVESSLEIHLHESIESTNSWLMNEAMQGAKSATACLAERQTSGRGRYGRQWISPYGTNIYLSILWRYPLSPADLGGLSLASGVATLRALHRAGLEGVGLKWPNDLLWNGKKLAGLLLEVAGESSGPSHVVVGVGLNTYLDSTIAEEVDQPWIDLARIPGGADISRNRLIGLVLDSLIKTLKSYQLTRLEPYIDEWKDFDLYYGKEVTLQSGSKKISGVHQGIDPNGALLLGLNHGTKAFHAGEVSLRPGVGGLF